jgi:hypothetical protein
MQMGTLEGARQDEVTIGRVPTNKTSCYVAKSTSCKHEIAEIHDQHKTLHDMPDSVISVIRNLICIMQLRPIHKMMHIGLKR